MGKVLVTGASGNVGRYVAYYAMEDEQQVKVAGTNMAMLDSMYGGKAEKICLDFTKPETFDDALNDVDRVFVMRPPHLGKPEDLKPFVEAMKNSGKIKLVSFLSLLGVEKNPIPPHHKIEKYIEAAGLPYCHIRPSFFMQNISGIHSFEITQFDRIVVPVKNAVTSFIDAEDIGEIIAKIFLAPESHQNRGYSITGPKAINYWEVAEILSEELGRKISYANPKPSLAKKYWLQVRGLEREYTNVMSMLYLMTRMGGAKTVTNTFEGVMGKAPCDFREFVRKNAKVWIKE